MCLFFRYVILFGFTVQFANTKYLLVDLGEEEGSGDKGNCVIYPVSIVYFQLKFRTYIKN